MTDLSDVKYRLEELQKNLGRAGLWQKRTKSGALSATWRRCGTRPHTN